MANPSSGTDDMVELSGAPPVAAAPRWATLVDPEPADAKNTQLEYLLIDRQLRVEEHGSSYYAHIVVHLGSQSAVDDQSHLQITYRPATERIILHRLTLRRGEQNIDQLRRARISTLRRELDLEQGIIDGELTTSIVLEDVRVGDILEYSYTRTTGEDGLNTAFSDSYTTQWSVPARSSHLRILYPGSRRINVRNTNANEQPQARDVGAWRELVWQWRGLSGIPREEDRPGWFDHYPYIQFSEYPSWQAVAHWAQPLYPQVQLSPELRTLVAQFKSSGASKQQQIVQALRFVQDNIRYTGIEIGPGGYQPQSPDVVLKRRFGDCKEKSYLLRTLLHALGVDARVALVSSYRGQATRNLLPSPAAFDHMIVQVKHDGTPYWFDTTRSLQGGTLDTIPQAHYGAALMIDDAGEFETIPAVTLDGPQQEVVERFDTTAGVFSKATMQVESTFLGTAADGMRSYLADSGLEEVTRNYLNFYKDKFPTISVKEPLRFTDDRDANKLVVSESYVLDPAFTKGENDKQHYLEFNAHPVKKAAGAPKTIVRTSALQLDHPTHVRYRAEVRLPEAWSVAKLDKTIADPAFTYHSSVRYERNTVTTEFEFKTLTDYVPAAAVPEYARKLEAVREDAYYYLSYAADAPGERSPFKLSLTMLFAALAGVVGGGLLARWLYRYENPRFPAPAPANAPEGITGWMLPPALSTIVTPLMIAYALYVSRNYFDAGVLANLGSGQDPVVAHWGKIGLFGGILLGYAVVVFSGFMSYLLFTKRRGFPPGFIAMLWLASLWSMVTLASFAALGLGKQTKLTDPRVIRDLLSATIWTAYILRSKRVRATFVRTRSTADTRHLPASEPPAINAL